MASRRAARWAAVAILRADAGARRNPNGKPAAWADVGVHGAGQLAVSSRRDGGRGGGGGGSVR